MQVKKNHLLVFVVLLLLSGAVATAFILKLERVDPATIEGLLWPQQKPVNEFELFDHNGQILTRQARQCAPHDRFLDVLIQKSIRRAGESKDALIRPASTSTAHKTLLRQRLPQMT